MNLIELLQDVDFNLVKGTLEKEINHIQYDSRKITNGDIFVCLSGFEVDGHDYAKKAIEAGATVIICEKDLDFDNIDESVTVIRVNEGRKT